MEDVTAESSPIAFQSLTQIAADLSCELTTSALWAINEGRERFSIGARGNVTVILRHAAQEALRRTVMWTIAHVLQECDQDVPERLVRAMADSALRSHLQVVMQMAAFPDLAHTKARDWMMAEQKIRDLNQKCVKAVRKKKAYWDSLLRSITDVYDYPVPPGPSIGPTSRGETLPDRSGIYFVWAKERCVYVGKSICIRNRARLGTHGNIKATDALSFLEFPVEVLNFAESFYIGILRPTRNFGGPQAKSRAARNSFNRMLRESSCEYDGQECPSYDGQRTTDKGLTNHDRSD